MYSFAEFNRPKLDNCTNLQKKHRIRKQNFLLVVDILNKAHHIREMDFWDFPHIGK